MKVFYHICGIHKKGYLKRNLCKDARRHACPPGHWVVLEALWAPGPGQALAGLVLAVFGGRAGVSRPESGDRSCGSSTARPPTRGAARWPDLQGRAYCCGVEFC